MTQKHDGTMPHSAGKGSCNVLLSFTSYSPSASKKKKNPTTLHHKKVHIPNNVTHRPKNVTQFPPLGDGLEKGVSVCGEKTDEKELLP